MDFWTWHLAAVARASAQPFLTYYDDATGERTELSYATFANWVAKTANFLTDLGAGRGDLVATLLPGHWQTVVVTFGAWAAGAAVAPLEPGTEIPAGTRAVFAAEDRLPPATTAQVVGLSLEPLAGRLDAVRPGVLDYAEEVPAYADTFTPAGSGDPDDVAFAAPATVTVAALLTAAERAATGARVAVTLPLTDVRAWTDGLLAAYARGAGVVLVHEPDPATWPDRMDAERVVDTVGPTYGSTARPG